eukprot:1159122-Pelagomonas_calceolata.AAC.7
MALLAHGLAPAGSRPCEHQGLPSNAPIKHLKQANLEPQASRPAIKRLKQANLELQVRASRHQVLPGHRGLPSNAPIKYLEQANLEPQVRASRHQGLPSSA